MIKNEKIGLKGLKLEKKLMLINKLFKAIIKDNQY